MAIKVDMGKSYDRVECGFIESVMEKMGFPRKMDSTNHTVYIYNILLCDYQWSSPQVYLPYKRSPSKRPLISLFVSFMCKWVLFINKGCSEKSAVEWNFYLQRMSHGYSFILCERQLVVSQSH